MFPWKIFFRFFTATVLFATGGFAVGAELPVPFDVAPAEVTAPVPVVDVVTTTTTIAGEVDGSTTTTTTAPEVIQVPVPLPVSLPELTDPPADAVPATPAPTAPTAVQPATPVGAPAAAPADAPPAVPVDADARSVCAAAKKVKACGPVIPSGDNSHAARVQRCQDWWNSLAQAFDQNNRPAWANRAREIAVRCEAMITRWEAAQQRAEERRERREKGDHNGDGHPDNGWRNKDDRGDRDRRGRGDDERPGPKPAAAKADKISRHSEGRQ